MIILGIETSCDDTATALVRDGRDVLSSVSTNQDSFHAKYGGIVPEIASRQHVALLSAAVDDALSRAGMTFAEVDAIGVTRGPGLIGSLVVGVASAKALAFALNKPLYAVNHLHGHIFAAFLDRNDEPPYPFLALLVSGGHSQLVDVRSATDMHVIGRTRDDAAGEAYDKTARLLGLPYPGGPQLDALARDGQSESACVSAPSCRCRHARPIVLGAQDFGTVLSRIRRGTLCQTCRCRRVVSSCGHRRAHGPCRHGICER